MSDASERVNGRASGPVLSSGFLVDLAYSAMADYITGSQRDDGRKKKVIEKKEQLKQQYKTSTNKQ